MVPTPRPHVGARVVGGVHLVGVDGREDGAEVLAPGRHRHAAVDQRPAPDAAPLVHRDAAEVLGVQDAGVAGDRPVDGEAEEVAEGLLGLGAEPVRTAVGTRRVGEDLAVRPGGVPGHAHLDHVDVNPCAGEAQGGDGTSVPGAYDQNRDMVPAADHRRRSGGARLGGGGVSGEGCGSKNETCSSHESPTRDLARSLVG